MSSLCQNPENCIREGVKGGALSGVITPDRERSHVWVKVTSHSKVWGPVRDHYILHMSKSRFLAFSNFNYYFG